MKNFSQDGSWVTADNGDISRIDGKFYGIIHGPHGNPVVFQPQGGDVYLTLVKGQVLCEQETVYNDGRTPTKQWRIVRASLDNPDHPGTKPEAHLMGKGYSNTARIFGPPDNYWLVELPRNPDPEKYALRTLEEVAISGDGLGKAALAMYLILERRVSI